jgi:hypothetical protein
MLYKDHQWKIILAWEVHFLLQENQVIKKTKGQQKAGLVHLP